MTAVASLLQAFVAVYRLVIALCNAWLVLLQVMRSVMQEAKREAAEVMALLDDDLPMTDVITSTSSLPDTVGLANAWQMLIIARASSFVLLVRLSQHRVLHLEVDERFIAAKLEVIQTELIVRIQHLPRLLQAPIGTHDTQLVRYTPMRLPYVWKEDRTAPGRGGEVPAISPPSVSAGSEGRSRRKKYVQLLTESALRRRLHMDRLGRATTPKRGMDAGKPRVENTVKRKALTNATNADGDKTLDETHALDTSVTDTPKQVRMERHIHAALSENLSIPNMGRTRKSIDGGGQSLRRKRVHTGLYAPGVANEFSLLPRTGQGRD